MARNDRLALVMIFLSIVVLSGCVSQGTPRPTAPTAVPLPTSTPTVPPTPSLTPLPTLPPSFPMGLAHSWRATTVDAVASIGSVDVDGDGREEVWAASRDRFFYLLDATGEQRWSFLTGGALYAGTSADLDGDGGPELLFGGDDNTVYALGGDGALHWSYPAAGRVTHLVAGDVDADGQTEVVAAAWDGSVGILGPQGGLESLLTLEGVPSGLVLTDLDNDGAFEIIAGTEAGTLSALTPAGTVLWQHDLKGPVRSLSVSDLDGDGRDEVLAAGQTGMVVAIDQEGSPRWAERAGGTIIALTAVPQLELVLVGRAGGVLGLGAVDGSPLWEYGTEGGVWTFAVLGVRRDPILAAGTDGGQIILFNRWGQVHGETQLPSRVHGLFGGDLDGDGRFELVARSGDHVQAFHTTVEGEPGESQPYVPTMPRWPDPSPLPPLPEGRISLLLVGDLMVGRTIEDRMRAYGVSFPFEPFGALLQGADITVGNLECALSQGGKPEDKPYTYRAHPDMAAGLAWAGFDVLNLANDHITDFGLVGLAETLSVLEVLGIRAVGAGPGALAPVVVEVRGIRVAFLARNAVPPAWEGVAFVEDEEALRRDVQQASAQADFVVLLLHAGENYADSPTEEQQALARGAVEAGADLVVGYHSHVLQPTERQGAAFIAYGLGDFVFDIDIMDEARDGAALYVVLTEEGVVRMDWVPTRIVNDVQPRPLAAPGGEVAVESLTVEVAEPLPPPPSPRPAYALSAEVDPQNGQVDVHEQLVFPNTTGDTLEELILYVFPNAFAEAFILGDIKLEQGGQSSAPSYTLSETTLRLFLPSSLAPGEEVVLDLDYTLHPPLLDASAWPPEGNLGWSEGGRSVHLGHWYAQLVPYRRGYGWQTWPYHPVGDPFCSDVADYAVVVTAPDNYVVVGGGERQKEGDRWVFNLEAGRDFAVFVGRNYAELEGQVGAVRVFSVHRREHAEAGLAALEVAEEAMAVFLRRYGPYPFETFTVFEGDLYGGMEYSGIVSVGAEFYESYGGTPQEVLPALVAHELAHQWWYGVVGNNQIYEPWLDEAMARYSEVLFYEEVYPEAVDWWWEARVNAWGPAGHIDVEIYDFDDTASYVHHLYPRASQFMRDLRQRIGDETFFRFLQRYYRENAFKRVSRLDFFLLLQEETSAKLDDLLDIYFGR